MDRRQAQTRSAIGHFVRAALAAVGVGTATVALALNGFDLKGASVPAGEILRGGPPRDGIPSIDQPKFVPSGKAGLRDDDRILGVARNGVAKAYPIRILNWHEIVNDRFGDEPIVVTYCPLCGTGIAFKALTKGKPATFGVSGLLYNSDVLLYDRESESLWSQIKNEAVTGPMRGERLHAVPTANTTWAEWRTRHPGSLVLSQETGFVRDYSRDPYAGYESSPHIMFPVANRDDRLGAKDLVLGLRIGDRTKAYPFAELARAPSPMRDALGPQRIEVHYDRAHRTARVLDDRGEEIPSLVAYWFAWAAFHPKTELFKAPQ